MAGAISAVSTGALMAKKVLDKQVVLLNYIRRQARKQLKEVTNRNFLTTLNFGELEKFFEQLDKFDEKAMRETIKLVQTYNYDLSEIRSETHLLKIWEHLHAQQVFLLNYTNNIGVPQDNTQLFNEYSSRFRARLHTSFADIKAIVNNPNKSINDAADKILNDIIEQVETYRVSQSRSTKNVRHIHSEIVPHRNQNADLRLKLESLEADLRELKPLVNLYAETISSRFGLGGNNPPEPILTLEEHNIATDATVALKEELSSSKPRRIVVKLCLGALRLVAPKIAALLNWSNDLGKIAVEEFVKQIAKTSGKVAPAVIAAHLAFPHIYENILVIISKLEAWSSIIK